MIYTYKLLKNNPIDNKESDCIIRIEDNAFIPKVGSNTDYQEYLAWLKASPKNVAEEAD